MPGRSPNPPIAELLSRVKWMRYIRMAYDSTAVRDDVRKAIERLKKMRYEARKDVFLCAGPGGWTTRWPASKNWTRWDVSPLHSRTAILRIRYARHPNSGDWPAGATINRRFTP